MWSCNADTVIFNNTRGECVSLAWSLVTNESHPAQTGYFHAMKIKLGAFGSSLYTCISWYYHCSHCYYSSLFCASYHHHYYAMPHSLFLTVLPHQLTTDHAILDSNTIKQVYHNHSTTTRHTIGLICSSDDWKSSYLIGRTCRPCAGVRDSGTRAEWYSPRYV